MLFNSVVFIFAFLPVAYVVFWTLHTARARYVWLTITGYVFYGYWDPRFCLLMAFSTLVSFLAGLGILRWNDNAAKRRLCLIVPITIDLALLGFFKYANFGLDTARQTLQLLGVDARLPHLDIILPVGISFYTFHTISYIIDSYRGTIVPTRDFWEFTTYVSLFSQLVAGPIVRFRQIEADLAAIEKHSRSTYVTRGISFFIVGLVEKVIVADSLAAIVDPSFQQWQSLSTLGTWMAVTGYSFQLLFDFSGYSTMAVGLGYLFGIRIPRNFNAPYRALDPSDFWQRWHISLSTCLRDYLYIPLGGNRGGPWHTYRNLMLTMLFGGLWHGASWTFVFWGFYHGLLLCIHRLVGAPWDALPRVVRQGGMFLAVTVGWVFFRATSFGMAWGMLERMFFPVQGEVVSTIAPTVGIAALCVAAWWSFRGPTVFELHEGPRRPSRALLVIGASAALALIVSARPSPFLYFQF
jgi:alginate O-acetyltransferase complex protein AlgI